MITKRQMGLAMPTAQNSGRLDQWYGPIVAAMGRHGITTPQRIDYFLANVAEETGELQAREESLHYSGARLRQVFPSLFDSDPGLADRLAAQGPQAIGNYIYADAHRPSAYRMGNRDPGDGYRYRGRGPMQLTGRANYEAFFRAAGLPIDSDPDLLLQPEMGAESAAQFWEAAGCNALADAGNFQATVLKVNGGTINLATRQAYARRFLEAMANPDPAPPKIAVPPAEELPPVTEAALKPAPQLEPVPPPPPVPPPGYSVQPSGNVVRDNVEDSSIVKASKVGKVVVAGAGVATAATGAVTQAKGVLSGISDVGAICLTVITLALLGAAFWYFHTTARDRRNMKKAGIA